MRSLHSVEGDFRQLLQAEDCYPGKAIMVAAVACCKKCNLGTESVEFASSRLGPDSTTYVFLAAGTRQ